MKHDISLFRGYDLETPLSLPGCTAPKIVCGSWSMPDVNGIRGRLLVDREDALRCAEEVLCSDEVITGANIAFDLAVLGSEDEELLSFIFQALNDERVYDVLIGESLNAIYGGHLGEMPGGGPLVNPATGEQTKRYSLALVTYLTLGRIDAKARDEWRLSYALLRGIHPSRWPKQAQVYPVDDAVNTLEAAIAQVTGRPGFHEFVTVPRLPGDNSFLDTEVCKHCRVLYNGSFGHAAELCSKGPRREPHQNLDNMAAQAQAAFALHLGADWSLRTDPARVAALAEIVQGKHEAAVKRFQKHGWYREDGSEDQAAVKRAIATAYGATGQCSKCGGTGRFRKTIEEDCRGAKIKGRFKGCLGAICLACGGKGKVEKLGNEVTCKNVFDESEKLVEAGCDGTGFDLDTAPMLPRTEKQGVSADRDTTMESGDDELSDFGEDEFNKSLSTYVPYLWTGVDRPLKYSANVIVATGRVSYEESPLHQMPRSGGERECIRARGAWCGCPVEYVLGSTDYEAGELCLSGDTRILTDKGYLPIRDLVDKSIRVASRFSDENSFIDAPSFHDARVFSTGRKSVLKIETVDGRILECTANHPVLIQKLSGKRDQNSARNHRLYGKPVVDWRVTDFEWRKASQIRPGDLLVSGAVAIDERKPRIDPKFYAFGHFVGDGWFCDGKPGRTGRPRTAIGVCASGSEEFLLRGLLPVWEDIVREAEPYVDSNYNRTDRNGGAPLQIKSTKSHFSISASKAVKKRSLGVRHITIAKEQVANLLREKYGFKTAKAPKKRFPACYWTATANQKRSFLRGLFDADGSVVTKTRKSISFAAANRELAREYLLALSEFGIEARMTTQILKRKSKAGNTRYLSIVQVRGEDQFERFAYQVSFVDSTFRSLKAERLASVVFKQKQIHRNGMEVKSVIVGERQPVFNLEVPTTRHYIAEGLVVHNCTLAQLTYWLFGYSKMRDSINESGKPGILHSDLASEVLGISLSDFLMRLKSGDKQAKDFRQAMKPINFGKPGKMGTPKLVGTNRKKNAGFTLCERGPAEDLKGHPGYWGIRFCVLTGGALECGTTKITQWGSKGRGYACAPVCKACCEIVENMLSPAYFRKYPEILEYFKWGTRLVEQAKRSGASVVITPCAVWDAKEGVAKIIRERGISLDGYALSALLNNGFQAMLSDIGKDAFYTATQECYLGVKADGSPSPLAGCRLPLYLHDEPLSELILETAHLSGPRIAEIMVESGRKFAPDVAWRAETALAFNWSKSMESVYTPEGKLIPWQAAA